MKWSLGKLVAIVIMVGFLAGIAVGITLYVIKSSDAEVTTHKFAQDFKFGAASASYQIEGGWDADGKSPNIWDVCSHADPDFIDGGGNGDVAADSYHFYQKDIDALANINFELYRFSISWSRIIPIGAKVNEAGVAYYNNLIDGLLAKGIKPVVTMYHWDLPQYIQDLGGWTNPIIVDYFKTYADVLFERFGDRVSDWITINEPSVFCGRGYSGTYFAPAIPSSGVGDYLCQHHAILASATAYRLYQAKYVAKQGGKIGVSLNGRFNYPFNSSVDPSYAEKSMLFTFGRYLHPMVLEGDYPQVMRDQIAEKSKVEGRPWSRLPEFTEEQKKMVKGSIDFIGLNYYSSEYVYPLEEDPSLPISWPADTNILSIINPAWPAASLNWLHSVPQGLHDLLVWMKDTYNNKEVWITENGWSDDGQLEDNERIEYFKAHLAAVARAVNADKCNVTHYFAWALIDNLEWVDGYKHRFGLHYIDYDSVEKTRVPKGSARFFKEFMKTKSFDYEVPELIW